MHRKLNLGCGTDIRTEFVNVDRVELPGIDAVVDLDRAPWPFEDGSFDFVLAKDVLEHCASVVPVMEEIHRVLAPGGRVHLQVPHFTSRNAHMDPTHQRSFSFESFNYFVTGHERAYYASRTFCQLEQVQITFDVGGRLPWNRPISWLVNRSDQSRRFFEMTPASVFRAMNVEVILQK